MHVLYKTNIPEQQASQKNRQLMQWHLAVIAPAMSLYMPQCPDVKQEGKAPSCAVNSSDLSKPRDTTHLVVWSVYD